MLRKKEGKMSFGSIFITLLVMYGAFCIFIYFQGHLNEMSIKDEIRTAVRNRLGIEFTEAELYSAAENIMDSYSSYLASEGEVLESSEETVEDGYKKNDLYYITFEIKHVNRVDFTLSYSLVRNYIFFKSVKEINVSDKVEDNF